MSEYTNASLIITPNAFGTGKIFALKPTDGSGDMPYARNSLARRRNSALMWENVAANVPRLHYPIGGGCPSWLNEPPRTNTVSYPSDFSNAVWVTTGTASKTPSSLPSNIVGITPYDIAGLGAAGVDCIKQTISSVAARTFTVFIRATDAGDVGKTINLTGGGGLNTNIVLTLAWQEFTVYHASANSVPMLSSGTSGSPATKCTISYIGAEVGEWGTSPIIGANAAAPISRIGDLPFDSSAANVLGTQSWTTFFHMKFNAVQFAAFSWHIRNASYTSYVGVFPTGSNILLWYKTLSGSGTSYDTGVSCLSDFKVVVSYDGATLKYFVNGVLKTTISAVLDNFTQIGRVDGDSSSYNLYRAEHFANIVLPDAECVTLSTL